MTGFIQKTLDLIPFGLRDRIRHMPGVKQIQAMVMKRYMDGKEMDVTISGGPAKGLVFPIKLPQDKQMWIGTWELDFAQALQQRIKPGWVCFDIGGYKGYYGGVMALQGASRVVIFEPMPGNIESIRRMIGLNPSLPISLEEAAASDSTGEAVFNLMPEETMGKLEKSTFQQSESVQQQVNVRTVALDDLAGGQLPEPDFIKIDVEGAEEFVLKGALNLLRRKKPMLMIEVHSPEIGKRCLVLLRAIYPKVTVMETGKDPEEGTPMICHYLATM